MKRQYSSLVMMVAMVCFLQSAHINASGLGEFADDVLISAGTKGIQDAALTASIKGLDQAALKDIAESTVESLGQSLESVALKEGETLLMAQERVIADTITANLKSAESVLTKFGTSIDKFAAKDITKFASKDLSKMSINDFDKEIDSLSINSAEKTALKQQINASKSIFTKASNTLNKAVSSVVSEFKSLPRQGLDDIDIAASKNADEVLANSASTQEEKALARQTLKNLEYKTANIAGKLGRNASSFASHASSYAMYGLATISAAILFMIPSIFQSAFLAQQQQNALMETYLPPVQFGNLVLQLPDSVINISNPAQSDFIYYGIPVDHPGAPLSAEAKAAYPGVTGPDANNKVSKLLSNSYAKAFSLGAAKKPSIPRYNLSAQALESLPIFVSYSSQSWNPWGSNGIPDAAFTEMMINLNTGYIFYGDGTSQGTPPAPLVGTAANDTTVQSFLATKYGQLANSSSDVTYTQYVDSYSSSRSNKVASPIANQFNCSCLENNKGVLSANTLQTCSGTKTSTCLLTKALNQLAAGLVLNSQGTVLTPDQDLPTEIAKGALGQVIPIQGLGKNFSSILAMFPGAAQNAIANSGALTITLGSNLNSATPIKIQGAEPDNYVAKGVYVYECKNTPLAKMLRSQSGGSATASYANLITDYIVFLDANLNQVPLMTPVQDPHNYNFIKMGLNPAITYFSTLIGSFDSNNTFSFIPQMNIQSPAALVAQGLPASFPPLYGLSATNGSLAVNYNQNLPSAVGAMAQALIGNAKLGQQFKDMQAAMLRLIESGPFGKYQLTPVDSTMQPNIGGVVLNLYTGYNAYPVSQDQSNSSCTDVLIPLSSQGSTVTLPSNNVAQYYGLVSDITYTVAPDGTISVGANGLVNSPLSQTTTGGTTTWSIDQSKVGTFYWINKLTAKAQQGSSASALPQPLIDFVTQARASWINWIESTSNSSLSNQEFAGTTIPGSIASIPSTGGFSKTPMVLTIANQQALANNLYIYTCSPNPSNLAQDYFVLTNSSSPVVTDPTLGTMSSSSASVGTNLLSIVSGLLYNSSGNPVVTATGSAYSVDPVALLKSLNQKNPQAFSKDFKAALNVAVSQANTISQSLVYPYSFGPLQLGIYQSDLNNKVYLYVNAAGAGTSTTFKPTDYFVTIDSFVSPSVCGQQLSSSTQYVASLVSGKVYNQNGVQSTLTAAQLSTIIASLSPSWRVGVAVQIKSLTAQFATVQKNQQQQTNQMDAAPLPNSGDVTWPIASVTGVIGNLSSQDYLPSPYSMIKQDPNSGIYVLVSPANADGTEFMYTFFDVPNNFVDGKGNSMHVGASYDGQGNLLRTIQGIELISLMHQYGIAVDSTGNQYLGANNMVPIMQLDPADFALTPGVSGKSMIYSNDPKFPSGYGIVSPITYKNSKFYLYYNVITKGYYAMQVTPNDSFYIDMAGGNVYNLDGTARATMNPVAVNINGDATDLFLPYLNADRFMQCVMKNQGNNGSYSDFLNLESNFQPDVPDVATNVNCGLNSLVSNDSAINNVTVSQMPFPANPTSMPDLTLANTYNVYWDPSTPTTYKINSGYSWQDLKILPIDLASGTLLNPAPADLYSQAGLILNNGKIYALVFANQLYSGVKKSSTNSYSLTSGTDTLSLSILTDSKTNVQYVSITDKGLTYNYQYMFLPLSDAQLQNYQQNVWQSQIIVDVYGRVILEKYLPLDSSGNVKVVPVSPQSIANFPTNNATAQSLLANIVQDTTNNRFLAMINDPSQYSYFNQTGYVDLSNGILFTSSGSLVGYILQISDFMDLLQQLSVTVVYDANNNAILAYKSSASSPVAASMMNNSTNKISGSMTQGSSGGQSRSSLLGRLSSRLFGKKRK